MAGVKPEEIDALRQSGCFKRDGIFSGRAEIIKQGPEAFPGDLPRLSNNSQSFIVYFFVN
jgi:hypothetical protein